MNRRRFLTAAPALFGLAAAPAPAAATVPALMGGKSEVPIRQTPGYGIGFNSNGFDRGHKKRIRVKTPNLLRKRGAAHLVDPFIYEASLLTEFDRIPLDIDEAFHSVKGVWLQCAAYRLPGAKMTCGEAARRFNPADLYVEVMEAPFWVQEYGIYANGAAYGVSIKIVNITAGKLISEPHNAYLIPMRDLARWEFGNALAHFAGYTGAEVGFQSPCSMSVAPEAGRAVIKP